jgi:hypothetical protein
MSPGGDFPDIGCRDIFVGPVTLGFPNHLFEVFVGELCFFFSPEPLPRGFGCSFAFIVPPPRVESGGSPNGLHHGLACLVEHVVDGVHPAVDIRGGGDGEEGGEFEPQDAVPLFPGFRINVRVESVGVIFRIGSAYSCSYMPLRRLVSDAEEGPSRLQYSIPEITQTYQLVRWVQGT